MVLVADLEVLVLLPEAVVPEAMLEMAAPLIIIPVLVVEVAQELGGQMLVVAEALEVLDSTVRAVMVLVPVLLFRALPPLALEEAGVLMEQLVLEAAVVAEEYMEEELEVAEAPEALAARGPAESSGPELSALFQQL